MTSTGWRQISAAAVHLAGVWDRRPAAHGGFGGLSRAWTEVLHTVDTGQPRAWSPRSYALFIMSLFRESQCKERSFEKDCAGFDTLPRVFIILPKVVNLSTAQLA